MFTEEELIKGCKAFNEIFQKALYNKYSFLMKAICLRYCPDNEEANDLLQDGFIKVFCHIQTYSGKGSFEGWMKRIFINTCIKHLKKSKKYQQNKYDRIEEIADTDLQENDPDVLIEDIFSLDDIMNALNNLPEFLKVVFNLFYMENLSHHEIAELLSIDEKTSRTRLFRAKKLLKELLTSKLPERDVKKIQKANK